MTQTDSAWDLGGGGKSFSFDKIGDSVEGLVLEVTERQGTNMETGEPDWWDAKETQPKMITVLTLQTQLRESPDDDGIRTVTLSGSKKPETESRMAAMLGAVKRATGGTALQYKGWARLEWYAERENPKRGMSAFKLYRGDYRVPAMDLDPPATQQTATQQTTTRPADAWQGQGNGPAWAQQQANPNMVNPETVNMTTGEIRTGAPVGAPVTAAQVAGLQALGIDPGSVYGPDWQSRVTP